MGRGRDVVNHRGLVDLPDSATAERYPTNTSRAEQRDGMTSEDAERLAVGLRDRARTTRRQAVHETATSGGRPPRAARTPLRRTEAAGHPDPVLGAIGEMLVSCRSLAEYRGMFGLSDADLAGRVLDCPGGAASAVADLRALGVDALACDPLYGTGADLAARARNEVDRAAQYVADHPDEYVWTWFRDPTDYVEHRRASAERFVAHHAAEPARYVRGTLPALPFPDRTFDLVLCSHLLFSYVDRLDEAFHLAALRELVRVGRGDVRVFPLVPMGSDRPVPLDGLRAALAADGVASRVVPTGYEFQRGGAAMLALTGAPDGR